MCWVALNGVIADLFENFHPPNYLFQLVTYDNFFITLLEFPAPFQASFLLFVKRALSTSFSIANSFEHSKSTLHLSSSSRASAAFFSRGYLLACVQKWISMQHMRATVAEGNKAMHTGR
jgi:hypothetical protein